MIMFSLFKKELSQKLEIPKDKKLLSHIIVIYVISFISGIFIVPFLSMFISHDQIVEYVDNNVMSSTITIASLYFTAFTSCILIWYSIKWQKRSLYSLGITKQKRMVHYLLGLAIGFITLTAALVLTILMQGASFEGFVLNHIGMLIVLFFGFVLQGFEEELMCRGFMMYGLSKTRSTFACIMTNSLFFSLLHFANDGFTFVAFVNIFLAGLFFSCLAVYFDDIWVASGAHTMWNFAQGNLYGILVSGMDIGETLFRFKLSGHPLISGGTFGLEGSISVTIVLILSVLGICWWYGRKQKEL